MTTKQFFSCKEDAYRLVRQFPVDTQEHNPCYFLYHFHDEITEDDPGYGCYLPEGNIIEYYDVEAVSDRYHCVPIVDAGGNIGWHDARGFTFPCGTLIETFNNEGSSPPSPQPSPSRPPPSGSVGDSSCLRGRPGESPTPKVNKKMYTNLNEIKSALVMGEYDEDKVPNAWYDAAYELTQKVDSVWMESGEIIAVTDSKVLTYEGGGWNNGEGPHGVTAGITDIDEFLERFPPEAEEEDEESAMELDPPAPSP